MIKKKVGLLFALCLFAHTELPAQVKLSPLFTDHMVLQQQSEVPVWGTTKPGKKVEVAASWSGEKKYTTSADKEGKWQVKLPTPIAGGPYTITVSDGKPVRLKDVMIGEVWLCSGQSNMEMQVEGWGKVLNYQQEIQEAQRYPNIRFLQVTKANNPLPISEMNATNDGWQICSSQTVADFSALGYFFGRELNTSLNVPIGLIDATWGGTLIEAWTSLDAVKTVPSLKKELMLVAGTPEMKEQYREAYRQELEAWERKAQHQDKGYTQGKAAWAAPDCEDSDWKTMKVPGLMQSQGLEGFNGIVWFRKEIQIPSDWEGQELTLHVGMVDDFDLTFFNGVAVGHSEGWNVPRKYIIPRQLVKNGKAVITVRVLDMGGGGGIHGAPENLYLEKSASERIELAGDWRYNVSANIKDLPVVPTSVEADPQNLPTVLFNAMLHPLIPYTVKGAIWYQGESNADRAYQYRELLPLMITDWRQQWGYDFPFYTVQLANYTAQQSVPSESSWAELREAQTRALNLSHTGMAVTIDIGEEADIHPKNKQEVGRRLALAARAQTYGEKIAYSGPMFDSYRMEGTKIRVQFTHTGQRLTTANNAPLKGFAVAGVDHKFHWADAVIEGNSVVVSSPEVAFPIAVRYAWADNPECNLYNDAGLPASPFRTDDWMGRTYRPSDY